MTDLRNQTATERPAGERWGRIPAWWLDHPDLDADGLAVLAALSTYADEAGVCWPSQATLAAKLKRSRPTVNRILGRLEALGLVAIEHRSSANGGRLSCRYRLSLVSPSNSAAIAGRDSMFPGRTAPVQRIDSPCPEASQEQLHPEQLPDSLPAGAQGGHPQGNERPGLTPARDVPADWIPNTADRIWAADRFPDADLDAHAELFVRRCQAHGYRYRDIGAAWRSWLLQDMPAASRASHARKAGPSVSAPVQTRAAEAEQRVSAWACVAAQLNATIAHAAPAAPSSPWIVT